ncbi:MAG: hypothetical protein ABI835_18730 [Chloroflexota bacterium]
MTDDQRKRSAFRPLLGFLILVILGVLAWLIAPAAIRVLADVLPFFRGNELPLSTTRPLFTAVIIVLALIVLGLVAALTAPKDEQGSSVKPSAAASVTSARRRESRKGGISPVPACSIWC